MKTSSQQRKRNDGTSKMKERSGCELELVVADNRATALSHSLCSRGRTTQNNSNGRDRHESGPVPSSCAVLKPRESSQTTKCVHSGRFGALAAPVHTAVLSVLLALSGCPGASPAVIDLVFPPPISSPVAIRSHLRISEATPATSMHESLQSTLLAGCILKQTPGTRRVVDGMLCTQRFPGVAGGGRHSSANIQ